MKIRHLRWWICGLLFAATTLSFLDRQVLSVVAPLVSEEFGMSNEAYSYVTTAFLASYAITFLLMGRVIDVVGTRIGMLLSVGVWTIASALHAFVQNPLQLGILRFLLGAGEGGCFPGAAKGAAEWFPPRERALAIGIAIGGASLGGVIAPPLTVWLAAAVGWRGAFIATGIIGAVWLLFWWIFYYTPIKSPYITDEELAHIRFQPASGAGSACAGSESRPSLRLLFARKDVWGLAAMRFLVDPVFYFYMFWIPKYLSQERGAPLADIGRLTWIPFLALGISNIIGGWLSDRLIAAGYSADAARKLVMAAAAALTAASSFTPFVCGSAAAIGVMALLMFAHGFWITNYVTIISEAFPQNAVATVMGLTGMIGTVGGMVANTLIGAIADRYSFMPIWIASGCMYPVAFGVLLATVGSWKTNEAQEHDLR
jgi:MFS transporter, ACS family, hexuronate transporter